MAVAISREQANTGEGKTVTRHKEITSVCARDAKRTYARDDIPFIRIIEESPRGFGPWIYLSSDKRELSLG